MTIKSLSIGILSSAFFLALLHPAGAETIEFPKKKPTFSVEVPDGWTTKFSPDGTLTIRNEKAVVIFGEGLRGVHDEASAREAVPIQARETAKAAKLENLKEKRGVTEFPMTDEINAVGAEYTCESNGAPCVYQAFIFSPDGSHYYSAEVNTVSSAVAATKEDRHAIIQSVTASDESSDSEDDSADE